MSILKEIKQDIADLYKNDARKEELIQKLKTILNLIDLTTLEGSDNEEKVVALANKALSFEGLGLNLKNVAAVCVYPTMVHHAKSTLVDSGLPVAAVAGAFPSSQSPLHLRVEEVKYAVSEGANEIDMVISTGRFLEGDINFLHEEVAAIKEACGEAHLKVILETGILDTEANIRLASKLAIQAGADFIKTSTGKVAVNATPEAMITMCQVIKNTFEKDKKRIGIKPAGGISDPETALIYFTIVEKILGEDWLNNKLFRIGASRLADALVKEISNFS
jgi:deoxyribose-phosphate aldolase